MKNNQSFLRRYSSIYTALLFAFAIGLLSFIYTKDSSAFGIATLKEPISLFNDQQVTLWASTEKFKNGREYYWLTKDDVALADFQSLQQYLKKESSINCGQVNNQKDKVWFVICLNGIQKDKLLQKIRNWEMQTVYAPQRIKEKQYTMSY